MDPQPPRPPRLSEALLGHVLPHDPVGRSILGDLREEYVRRARGGGHRSAGWWYRREAAGLVLRALVRKAAPGSEGGWDGDPGHIGAREKGDSMGRKWVDEIRLAVRALLKAPRFTVVAVLTLALGIGASAAVFSAVEGVLLKPLDYPDSDELAMVWSDAPGLGYEQFGLSPDIYLFYRSESAAFQDMGIVQAAQLSLTGDGDPERVAGAAVSPSLFTTLEVQPGLGRTFTEEEDLPDAEPVVVLGHDLWMRRYGGDPATLGTTVTVNGEARRIIGVMPERFAFPEGASLWVPTGIDPANPPVGSFTWTVVGRLAPGVGPEQAQAQLVPLVRRIMEINAEAEQYYNFLENGHYAPLVHSLKADAVGSLEEPLWILLGTVGFVLLIVCANVANLVLIRAEGRQRETAVRAALGAGRGALVRLHLAETLVLAGAAGVAGIAMAWAGVAGLLRFAPPQLPRIADIGIDPVVLLFGAAVSVLSALLFGVAPALRYTRPSILGTLRTGARGSTTGRRQHLGRGVLVVAQTALAMVLLVGSGLMVRSFWRIWHADAGFRYDDVLTFSVALPPSGYPGRPEVVAFHRQLLDELAGLPGVTSVGATSNLPLSGGAPGTDHMIEGRPVEAGQLPPIIHYATVTPGYFETLRVPLLRGEAPVRGVGEAGARSVVVNRALADTYWPGESPLGRRLRPAVDTTAWYTVAGVVESIRQESLRRDPRPMVYYAMSESASMASSRTMTYVIGGPDAASLGPAVRRAVWDLDANLPVARMQTMANVVSDSVVQLTFTMLSLGVAALMALILGAVGLYGVLSYAVSQRTREIGVRIALGAERSTVMGMVVAQGARLAVLGLVLGLVGAAALTRILGSLLYGTEALDPVTFAGTTAILLLVALVASYVPARHAAAVSPMESIRVE